MTETKETSLTSPDHVKNSTDHLITQITSGGQSATDTNIANQVIFTTSSPPSLFGSCLLQFVTGQLDKSEMNQKPDSRQSSLTSTQSQHTKPNSQANFYQQQQSSQTPKLRVPTTLRSTQNFWSQMETLWDKVHRGHKPR
jgi:hypothetical protein